MVANAMKKYGAELFGTFALVLIGVGSAVLAGDEVGYLGIAFAFGLVLLSMVYAIGDISGCHVNPAVTIGVLALGRMPVREAIVYIIVQCIGAIIAAGVVLAIATGTPAYSLAADGLGQNGYGEASPGGYSLEAAFISEVVMTALFVFVILAATSIEKLKGFAGLAIGMALAMVHIATIPVDSTSVNPARSLGPALFAGGEALAQLWVFWVAPILGAILAAIIWRSLMEYRTTRPVAVAEAARNEV
ncbi:porin [Methanoculleus taiwanensis]|uniref:Porin n=1 Tax=Methanoculleus taiwanensis TaxID=1550565 RepID=A0A498H4V4_9EURY|nr:aquaporin Z [Methanoculleus taiwanensis]RXE57058.1 porin [Methanoculleus taiwanensis]